MFENYLVANQKRFKLDLNINTVKEIVFTSIVVLAAMTVLLTLYGVPVIAQETNVGIDSDNTTGPDSNNLTTDDNANEPEAGMISRKD
jgi:cation transporter-like permease